ncbi:MAG: DUF262 domain-containing protein [Desulfobacteraceae bacterium]|nr:DUF262 domain-containing protein [Desulfobacteraceae bacterium]MBC2718108.1 DUF262 domain-containing protein [Desulfobacteraceae bacterium]
MSLNNSMDKQEIEGEEGLSSRSQDVYPDAVVKISRDQYSVFEIKRMAETTKEFVIAPEFQRHDVWKIEQKRELIESVLMNIPIPVVYVFEDETGKKQVVDGRQRISTLISFLNNEFALANLKLLSRFDGKKFKDFEPIFQSKIERYQISVYVIEPPTPERVKYDIFDRVNRGGTQLNSQEIRNALYYGSATILLKELSVLTEFKDATGNGIKPVRMRDQYLILRFFAFYILRKGMLDFKYKNNIDDLLSETMKFINDLSQQKREFLKSIFRQSMGNSFNLMGKDGFRFAMKNSHQRQINMALFETLAYFFAIFNNIHCDSEKIRVEINALKFAFDESGYFSSRVNSSSSVEYRFKQVEKLAEELA